MEALEQLRPVLPEDGREHLFLGGEVVVEEPVRDAGLLGDVADPGGVVAVAREHADRRGENELPLLLGTGLAIALRALACD